MKRIMKSGAVLLGSLVSLAAFAQELSQEDAQTVVDQRQAVFNLLAYSNGPLGQMARGGEFDQDKAIEAAERVAYLADFIPEVFAVDTSGASVESRAVDSIWDSKDDFDALAMDLKQGAESAAEILRSEGQAGVRRAIQQIGPKCGACHDRFRLD